MRGMLKGLKAKLLHYNVAFDMKGGGSDFEGLFFSRPELQLTTVNTRIIS